MRRVDVFLTLAAWCVALATAELACYFPDGSLSPNDVPCNTTAGASACCNENNYCLANGVCYGGGLLSRGSCTDKTWKDAACAPYCQDTNPTGGCSIMPCRFVPSGTMFTCNDAEANCTDDSIQFTLTNYLLQLKPSQLASFEAAASGISSSTSSATSGSAATSRVTVTASPTGSGDDKFSSGDMAGVGVGIGIPLLIAIGVLTFLLMRERKKNKTIGDAAGYAPAPTAGQPDGNTAYHAGYAPQEPMHQQPSTNWAPYQSGMGMAAGQDGAPQLGYGAHVGELDDAHGMREMNANGEPQELSTEVKR